MRRGPTPTAFFTVTHDISEYTRAAIFSEAGNRVKTFLRFSAVAGEPGAADAERDVRGFAVRFYTEEGNWDIVGNNIARVLCARSAEVPRLHPHAEAPPRVSRTCTQPHRHVGFLVQEPESCFTQVTILTSP